MLVEVEDRIGASAGGADHARAAEAAAEQPPPSQSPAKPAKTAPEPPCWAVGDPVEVLTDDQQEWMDGRVIAVFQEDTEAEGYDIPAGTVKVLYKLGLKWVMPESSAATLKRRDPLRVAPIPKVREDLIAKSAPSLSPAGSAKVPEVASLEEHNKSNK